MNDDGVVAGCQNLSAFFRGHDFSRFTGTNKKLMGGEYMQSTTYTSGEVSVIAVDVSPPGMPSVCPACGSITCWCAM